MATDTKQMSVSKDYTDARAYLCAFVQSGKKQKNSGEQLSSFMSAHGSV